MAPPSRGLQPEGEKTPTQKESARLGGIGNKQCRFWSTGHRGLGFWWGGFMEEMGLEDSLEGVKDLDGGEEQVRGNRGGGKDRSL